MARESKRRRDERRFGRPERLADMLLSHGARTPPWLARAETMQSYERAESMLRLLEICPVVSADNVCDYFYGLILHRPLNWVSAVPCWVPPFPYTFVEMSRPAASVPRGDWAPPRWGTMVIAIDRDDAGQSSLFRDVSDRVPPCPSEYRWIIIATLHSQMDPVHGGGYCSDLAWFVIYADDLGRVIGEPLCWLPCPPPSANAEQLTRFYSSLVAPAFLAIAFMNCRNVSLSPVDPDAKINRERTKAGLKPFLRYHTINIEPMKRVLRTEGAVESVGLKKALHICRGHFATYTEDKPLFGRSAGTFWRPSHVRGAIERGVVVSDYNVQPPAPNVAEVAGRLVELGPDGRPRPEPPPAF